MEHLSKGTTADPTDSQRLLAEPLIDLDVGSAGQAGILVRRHAPIIGAPNRRSASEDLRVDLREDPVWVRFRQPHVEEPRRSSLKDPALGLTGARRGRDRHRAVQEEAQVAVEVPDVTPAGEPLRGRVPGSLQRVADADQAQPAG